jgi:predicted TIM-barrel fold metal-dependent hydrolase
MSSETHPRLVAPSGACDTHMHFYDRRYRVRRPRPWTRLMPWYEIISN